MQTCPPASLLASVKAFEGLDQRQKYLAEIGLLLNWATLIGLTGQTPSALLASAAKFQTADAGQLSLIEAQLLCNLTGGNS